MPHDLLRYLSPIVIGVMMQAVARRTDANELLVFISAFAPGDEGAIHAYQLEPSTGRMTLVHRTTDVEHPFFIALSPDRKFLYSIHAVEFGGEEHEQVAAYEVEGRSGRLKLLNRQSARGSGSCYLEVDATGKTVLVANYFTGSVATLPVRDDGSLAPAASFFQHAGSSVDPARQKGPFAHCITVNPDNRFAFAADLGLDKILAYRLATDTAKLSESQQPFVRTPPGAGPRHLTFHPNGKHLYAINELENSVTAFDYLSESAGKLTEVYVMTAYSREAPTAAEKERALAALFKIENLIEKRV